MHLLTYFLHQCNTILESSRAAQVWYRARQVPAFLQSIVGAWIFRAVLWSQHLHQSLDIFHLHALWVPSHGGGCNHSAPHPLVLERRVQKWLATPWEMGYEFPLHSHFLGQSQRTSSHAAWHRAWSAAPLPHQRAPAHCGHSCSSIWNVESWAGRNSLPGSKKGTQWWLPQQSEASQPPYRKKKKENNC